MAAIFIESGQHLVQRHISTPIPSAAKFVIGRVCHDPEEPRPKGRFASEVVNPPKNRTKGILYDFLRVLRVPRDSHRQAIGPIAIRCDESLCSRRLSLAESCQQILVTVE